MSKKNVTLMLSFTVFLVGLYFLIFSNQNTDDFLSNEIIKNNVTRHDSAIEEIEIIEKITNSKVSQTLPQNKNRFIKYPTGKYLKSSQKFIHFQDAFNKDDICKITKLLRENIKDSFELPTLTDYLKSDPKSSELINILNLTFNKDSKNLKSEIELSFLAYSLINVNKHKSNKIFKVLQEIDPDNGAYYFFNLTNLNSKSAIIKEIDSMSRTKGFNSHFKWLSRTLLEATVDNFNAFQIGKSIHSKILYPDYLNSYKVIEKYNKEVSNKPLLSLYSKSIINKNLTSAGQFIDIFWIPMEYMLFKRIYYMLGNKRDIRYIKYTKLMNLNGAKEARINRADFLKNLNTDCSALKAEEFLDFERSELKKFKTRYDYK